MSDPTPLEASARRAKAAREQLAYTAGRIQSRLDPSRLMDDAISTVRDGAASIAADPGAAVRRRPAIAAGLSTLVIALVARRLFRRRRAYRR